MHKKLSLYLVTIIILGCTQTQTYVWVKPDASDTEYYKANSYCEALSTGSTPMDYSSEDSSITYHSGTVRGSNGSHANYSGISTTYNNNMDQKLNNLDQSIKRKKIFDDCMRGNGWLLQEQTQNKNATLTKEQSQNKKATLTEEQAINQLKYMMTKGFARMEKELIETQGFSPFGLVLFPDGEFKPLTIDSGEESSAEEQLSDVARNLETIAKTRAVWGVGIMYIRAIKLDDGSYVQRIVVMTEHIAGWARYWVYPFKVEDGVVKLGQPDEYSKQPIYFVNE